MNLKLLNILLADDDIDDCHFFKEALEALPMTTKLTMLHDGEQLMNYLIQHVEQLPHVLFLDINMPRKNGFECLAQIKLNEELKHIPVIIFSTSFEKEVVNKLYENGAKYFIRKPAEFSEFKKIILYVLTLLIQENISQPSKENFVLTLEKTLINY